MSWTKTDQCKSRLSRIPSVQHRFVRDLRRFYPSSHGSADGSGCGYPIHAVVIARIVQLCAEENPWEILLAQSIPAIWLS